MTPLEREAKWVRWPQGDAGDAVDFACDHAKEPVSFLEDWRSGRADEWPDYVRWLTVQREGARAAQGIEARQGGDVPFGELLGGPALPHEARLHRNDESPVANGDAPEGGLA